MEAAAAQLDVRRNGVKQAVILAQLVVVLGVHVLAYALVSPAVAGFATLAGYSVVLLRVKRSAGNWDQDARERATRGLRSGWVVILGPALAYGILLITRADDGIIPSIAMGLMSLLVFGHGVSSFVHGDVWYGGARLLRDQRPANYWMAVASLLLAPVALVVLTAVVLGGLI